MKPSNFLQFAICFVIFLVGKQETAGQVYLPDTSFWENQANMNVTRAYFPAVLANEKIYVVGGIISNAGGIFSYTDKIEQYDPGLDTWTVAGTLPLPMGGMAVAELDGAIYIIGGVTDGPGNATAKVYRFFPATGTFDADTIAQLPAPRAFLSASVAGGKIYAIGGATGFFNAIRNEVYVYDPTLNTWTTLPVGLTVARAAHTSVAVGNKVYIIGGTTAWTNSLSSVEVYDADNSAWTDNAESLSQSRASHGSAVLSDIIYALGGIKSLSSVEMSAEAFGPEIPEGDTWGVFNNLTYSRRAFGCIGWPTEDEFSYIYIMGGISDNSVMATTQRLTVRTVEVNQVSPFFPENTYTTLSNFPNPFDQNSTISYRLSKAQTIVISIFDARGQLVAIPFSGPAIKGVHQFPFDGSRLDSGVYFCVLNSNEGIGFVRKMVVIR